MKTPTNTPKAEKRRRTDLSPMYPPRNVDDESSEGMIFGSLSDAPSNTTDGTTATPGLNTSPEIVEAVRSFDALLASQNDTLGSLMDTPSGVLTPAGYDDDFLQMEELQLQRYSDQLQQELNMLAPRQGTSAARHRSPVTTPQRSPVPRALRTTSPLATVPSQDEEDEDRPEPDVAEATSYYHDAATSLNLSASPIAPSGSNVNTPASYSSPTSRPASDFRLQQSQHSRERVAALPSHSPLRPTPVTPLRTQLQPPPSSSSSSSGARQQDTTTSSSSGGGTTSDSSAMTVMFVDRDSSASDLDMATSPEAPSPVEGGEREVEGLPTIAEVDPSHATDSSTNLDLSLRSASGRTATLLAKGVLVPSPGSGHRSKGFIKGLPASEVDAPPISSENVPADSEITGAAATATIASEPTRQGAATSTTASPVRRNLFQDILRTPSQKSKPKTEVASAEDSKPGGSSFSPARLRTLVTGALSSSGRVNQTAAPRLPQAPPLEDEPAEVSTSPSPASGDSTGVSPPSPSLATSAPSPGAVSSAADPSPSSLSPEVIRTATALGLLGGEDEEEGSTGDENEPRSFPVPPLDSASSDPDHGGAWIAASPSVGSSTSEGEGSSDRHHRDILSTTLTTAPTAATTFDSADQVDDPDSLGHVVSHPSPQPAPPLEPRTKPHHDDHHHRHHGKGPKGAAAVGAAAATTEKPGTQASPPQGTDNDQANGTGTDCLTRQRKCEFQLGTVILLLVLFISLVVLVVTTVVLTNERNAQSAVSPSVPSAPPSPPPGMMPSPSPAATSRPNLRPISTLSPSQSPATQSLFDYLVSISPDGGAALRNATSPQHQAFVWLSNNRDLSSYSPMRLRQRYTLATFYYSTNGDQWDVSTNWMTNENECKWFSRALFTTVCGRDSEFQRLELSYNNLDGPIPPELSLLSDTLQNMSLSGGPNRYLTGTIPTELGRLTNLWNMRMWNNRLSGPIPSELGQLTNLQYFDLSINLLTGRIATEIGRLTALAWLDFSANRLSGRIPPELGQFSDLIFLDLSSNWLSGSVPPTFGNLSGLMTLKLDNNLLQRINANVGMMSSLESLSVANNSLSGTIPDSIGRLSNLQRLNLTTNQLNGTLPSSMSRMTMLSDELDLSHNRLVGTIPSWLGATASLLRILLLNDNRFNGTVPDSFASLDSVNVLRLDSTDLTGTVPSAVCGTFNETQPAFFADCEEVDCPCCTYCCNDTGCTCVHEGTLDDWKCSY